ncbi:MAG: putative rane protein [Lachnospiraceae bacterium]|nr:putative rane protein [Lachnospiraceae bacterium]
MRLIFTERYIVMGIIKKLFGKIRKEKNMVAASSDKSTKENASYTRLTEELPDPGQINYDSVSDRHKFITNTCEQILESIKQLEELKAEYQLVTSYLTDIQKIDFIPKEDREQLNEAARKILTFAKERAKYQNKTTKITDSQFKIIASYEDVMTGELKKMKDYEIYQSVIKNDLQHLEGEKSFLYDQMEDMEDKHFALNKMAVTTSVLVILLFIVFVILGSIYEANMQIPFFMTIIMAAISAVYILQNAGMNKKDLKLTELKINRAIYLLNKVKIKYINNTNALDYVYEKFNVKSYAELNYLWEQYIKAKEEEKIYRKNSELLELYNRELIGELKVYDLADPDIWIYQAAAILDEKEMVEVRHGLNVRRQKLRERLDYNNKVKENGINQIEKLLEKRPQSREEIASMLKDMGINL